MERSITDRVLFVHPETNLLHECILPLSVPALIRRIEMPVRGYFARELTPEAIRAAEVILVDVHWFFGLPGAKKLVSRVRSINPKARLIAGGMSASLFVFVLVEQLGFDFVVRGDAEKPLPALVASLLDGANEPDQIPNLVGRDGFETNWSYSLSQTDLDENEYFDLGFFPTAQQAVRSFHSRYFGWPFGAVFPWLVPFRGCPLPCEGCAGSNVEQEKYFRRKSVVRSAARLAEDLEHLDRDRGIRYVNCLLDFISLIPDAYLQEALARSTGLGLYFEMAVSPGADRFEFLLSRFTGGVIKFPLDSFHLTSPEPADPNEIIRLIRMTRETPGYFPILLYNGHFLARSESYKKALETIRRETKCAVRDEGYWFGEFPVAENGGEPVPGDFERFFQLARKNPFRFFNMAHKALFAFDRVAPGSFALGVRRLIYETLPRLQWRVRY